MELKRGDQDIKKFLISFEERIIRTPTKRKQEDEEKETPNSKRKKKEDSREVVRQKEKKAHSNNARGIDGLKVMFENKCRNELENEKEKEK